MNECDVVFRKYFYIQLQKNLENIKLCNHTNFQVHLVWLQVPHFIDINVLHYYQTVMLAVIHAYYTVMSHQTVNIKFGLYLLVTL